VYPVSLCVAGVFCQSVSDFCINSEKEKAFMSFDVTVLCIFVLCVLRVRASLSLSLCCVHSVFMYLCVLCVVSITK